jgi:hypothetical protein
VTLSRLEDGELFTGKLVFVQEKLIDITDDLMQQKSA